MGEAANLGLNFLPFPGMGLTTGAGRGIPSLMGLLRREAASGAESLASKSASLYNPPVKPPRPFAADYPSGAPADAAGRLTHDIEGRPLVAERIIGRRTLGGADETISPAELDALAEKILGRRPALAPASSLPRRSVGAYDPSTGRTFVYKGLPAETKDMVAAHELAHGINDKAGEFVSVKLGRSIPIKPGTINEGKTVYNDLNNSYLAAARKQNPDVDPKTVYWGTGVTPQKTFRYSDAEAPLEYNAEAIRAYMADPNYFKATAPRYAEQIREWVNTHPIVSKYLQFNSLAGLLTAGATGAALDPNQLPIPPQQAPVFPP
jgi:hypothetical protein